MPDDPAIKIELALRGARIAKMALELMELNPSLAYPQLVEVNKEVNETCKFLRDKGIIR